MNDQVERHPLSLKGVVRQKTRARRGALLLAFGFYTIAAIALFYQRNLFNGRNLFSTYDGDALLYVWMFHFLPSAIIHLQNPFILNAAWAPAGLNITQATTTPLLALLAWPITAVVGPVIAFNIVTLLAPALAATACFAFASAYAESWIAAFLAGWIYGFSSAVFAPMLGHLQVDFIAFLPLAFLAVTHFARGKITFPKLFIILGLALAAQFLVSLETFVVECIFLFIFVIVTEASRPGGFARLRRLHIDNLIVGVAVIYMAVGILMIPFIYSFFSDYAKIPHSLQDGSYYATDLLNFVAPTAVTWIGGNLAGPISSHFVGNPSEELAYMGAPLLALCGFAVWRLRREANMFPLLAVLGFAFVFTLGPRLHILGHSSIPLPWLLMDHLPFLSNALPTRFVPFVLLPLSGILAFWIDHAVQRRRVVIALLAIAAIFTLPATFVRPNCWSVPLPKATLFSSGAYKKLIREGSTVLFLPFNFANADALYWQTATNGYFRMTNGYGNFVPPSLASWPAADMLVAGKPSFDFGEQFDLFALANGIDKVIVPESIQPVWNAALVGAGWSPQAIGNFEVFSQSAKVRNISPIESSAKLRLLFDEQHLGVLRKAAACMLDKSPNTLDINISSAIAAGCLSSGLVPVPGDPRSSWDTIGGWLGAYNGAIGIGVMADAATASKIVAATGGSAKAIYFPYPKPFHAGEKTKRTGQLLEVFDRQAILRPN
jgi:hypothetical protein